MTGWQLTLAVESIRWDSDKRRAITERLSQNVKQPEIIDDLSEEFIATDLVTMDDVMTEEDMHMARRRSIRNAVIAILAAALLLTGGVAAAVAFGKRGGTYESSAEKSAEESSGTEQSRAAQTLELHLTEDGAFVLGTLGDRFRPHSTDKWYLAGETGWYSIWQQGTERESIIFTDAATGETVPFCARANCLHDGNDYCVATTEAYGNATALVDGGDVLYRFSGKHTSTNEFGQKIYSGCSLLAYEKNGTSISELAAFEVGDSGYPLYPPVVHRGYVFGLFRCVEKTDAENALDAMPILKSGWKISAYEIATGKVTDLIVSMPESTAENQEPTILKAAGDYLLFNSVSYSWDNEYKAGIWRIDLRTGKTVQLTKQKEMLFDCSGTTIFTNSEQVDLVTGESKPYPESLTDEETIVTDKIAAGDDLCVVSLNEESQYVFTLYDSDMHSVGSCALPAHVYISPESVTVQNGWVYAVRYNDLTITVASGGIMSEGMDEEAENHDAELIRCSMQAILDGTAEWETICTVYTEK